MKEIIGIDIGSLHTKVVEIEYVGKLSLIQAFRFPTPYLDTLAEQKEIDKKTFIKIIAERIPLSRLKNAKFAVNIPFYSPMVMTVILPKMDKNVLGKTAIMEARRKMIPSPGPNSVFEHFLLGETIGTKGSRYEVLVIKEEKECITPLLNIFSELGIIPSLISPLCAIYHTPVFKKIIAEKKDVALVDIGHSCIDISILREGNLVFSRNITFGCANIIEALATGMEISHQKAGEVLEEEGIPEIEFDIKDRVRIAEEIMKRKYEAGSAEGSSDEIDPLEVRLLWEPFIDRLIQELKRTFIFYKELTKGRVVSEVMFLGGGAQIKNLIFSLKEKVDAEFELLNPFEGVGIELEGETNKDSTLFANALSLALNLSHKPDKIVNFLPEELKKAEAKGVRRLIFVGIGLVLIAVFIFTSVSLWIAAAGTERSISRLDFEIERLKSVSQKAAQLRSRIQELKTRKLEIESLRKQRMNPAFILKEVVKVRPQEIMFTSLDIRAKDEVLDEKSNKRTAPKTKPSSGSSALAELNYEIEIEGTTFANYEDAYEIIGEFVRDLDKLKPFGNIKLNPPMVAPVFPIVEEEIVRLTEFTWRNFKVIADLKL
ncbi:MAG: pilus assembly protein PilM [Candidatus Omnitrophica bacterium]|nr:pilus assembly protein PilM [Candidatus Omnitrophota bacterium]